MKKTKKKNHQPQPKQPNNPDKPKQETRGRKSKLGQINLQQVEALAGLGLTDKEIANVLNISERALNYYKQYSNEFLLALQRGKDKADVRVIQSLYQQATSGNVTACIFWLKNRRKNQWRDKVDVEHYDNLEQRILNMTDEERKQRIEELKRKLLNEAND